MSIYSILKIAVIKFSSECEHRQLNIHSILLVELQKEHGLFEGKKKYMFLNLTGELKTL